MLKLSLCVGAAILAFGAPAATAAKTEVQRPDEQIYLSLHGKRGFEVYVAIYPHRHVAVLSTQKGEPETRKARWLGVAYAVHTSPEAFEGGINVNFGNLGRISGRFVPDEPPGDLAVLLPGLEVRLGDKRSEAAICVFTRRMLERVCE
jgi:hypothetical protein